MKFSKIIAVLLVCILAISPALAAVCATSCAATETKTSIKPSNEHCRMMAVMNQHENANKQSLQKLALQADTQHHPQNNPHKTNNHASCGMAGCNTAQILPLLSAEKVYFAQASSVVLTSYNNFGISADISPPIKPPA